MTRLRALIETVRRWRWLAALLSLLAVILEARRSGRRDAQRETKDRTDDHLIDRHETRDRIGRDVAAGDARERLRERFGRDD